MWCIILVHTVQWISVDRVDYSYHTMLYYRFYVAFNPFFTALDQLPCECTGLASSSPSNWFFLQPVLAEFMLLFACTLAVRLLSVAMLGASCLLTVEPSEFLGTLFLEVPVVCFKESALPKDCLSEDESGVVLTCPGVDCNPVWRSDWDNLAAPSSVRCTLPSDWRNLASASSCLSPFTNWCRHLRQQDTRHKLNVY